MPLKEGHYRSGFLKGIQKCQNMGVGPTKIKGIVVVLERLRRNSGSGEKSSHPGRSIKTKD